MSEAFDNQVDELMAPDVCGYGREEEDEKPAEEPEGEK